MNKKSLKKFDKLEKIDYNIFVIMNEGLKMFMNDTDEIFHTNYVTGKCTSFALIIFAECANHSILLFMNPS